MPCKYSNLKIHAKNNFCHRNVNEKLTAIFCGLRDSTASKNLLLYSFTIHAFNYLSVSFEELKTKSYQNSKALMFMVTGDVDCSNSVSLAVVKMSRLHVFKRCFHTAAVLCKFKPKQPYVAPMLQKMIDKGKNKRWDAPPNSSLPGIGRRITENSKRRAQFLGPILFRNIKEFFVTGELDDDYDLTVVEILRVQVTPDLSTAHVYWKATATEVDNEMQTLLNSTSGKIRHLLATYGVLNKVPQIVFVKDIAEAKHLEMLELLKQADMGDDYKWSEIFGTMKELDKMKKPEISDITKIGERFASGSHTDVTYLGNEQYSGHQSSGDVNTHSFNFTFHNDLYGIQHDTLMNKLIALKQRKKKRNIEENTQEENVTLDNMSKTKPLEGISKHLKMLQRKENEKPKKDKYDYISNMPKTLPLTHQAILMSNNRESSGQDNDES
ncbi:hypothetical protein KUTeg_018807, partial [Tegillarca granosa]